MSISRNHHYVSQCHIRYFRSAEDKYYYTYDKETKEYRRKPSEKSIFSEEDANTRFQNGQLDYQTLEDELNRNFENDFVKHARNILSLITKGSKNDETIRQSLYHIIRYGLISDVRSPHYKKMMDDGVNSLFRETARKIKLLGDEEQSIAILQQVEDSKTKYSNLVEYTKIADSRLKRMGNLRFTIANINSADKFILPDTGCYLKRAKINNYFNTQIQEVAIVGVPLTDKIFVLGESTKLFALSNDTLFIDNLPSVLVDSINKDLYDFAIKTVLTSDNDILNSIIEKCK